MKTTTQTPATTEDTMTTHSTITHYCAACGRLIPGPTGAPCRHCHGTPPARHQAERIDLLVAILLVAAVGATLLWPSMCQADGASPAGTAKASANVATAARLQAECMAPAECRIADEMLAAARAELVAALALADVSPRPTHHKSADPWQMDEYAEPFESLDPPEAIEAQAAFELAAAQTTIDGLTQP